MTRPVHDVVGLETFQKCLKYLGVLDQAAGDEERLVVAGDVVVKVFHDDPPTLLGQEVGGLCQEKWKRGRYWFAALVC
jgi:hypothetical protein